MNKEQLIADLKAMSVLELAELVKALEDEFGVSAAAGAVVAAGPAAAAAEPVEEKTEFDVILKEVGPEKIKVIKVVREQTGLSQGCGRWRSRPRQGRHLQGRCREDRCRLQGSRRCLRDQIRFRTNKSKGRPLTVLFHFPRFRPNRTASFPNFDRMLSTASSSRRLLSMAAVSENMFSC